MSKKKEETGRWRRGKRNAENRRAEIRNDTATMTPEGFCCRPREQRLVLFMNAIILFQNKIAKR